MLTTSSSEPVAAVTDPTIYSNIAAQAGFHLTFNPIYNHLISCHTGVSPSESLKFDAEITDWVRTLPPYFQEEPFLGFRFHWLTTARFRLSWRIRALRMLIFFPMLLHRVGDSGSQKDAIADGPKMTEEERLGISICLGYAHENIASIQTYFQSGFESVLGDWYAL